MKGHPDRSSAVSSRCVAEGSAFLTAEGSRNCPRSSFTCTWSPTEAVSYTLVSQVTCTNVFCNIATEHSRASPAVTDATDWFGLKGIQTHRKQSPVRSKSNDGGGRRKSFSLRLRIPPGKTCPQIGEQQSLLIRLRRIEQNSRSLHSALRAPVGMTFVQHMT
jgi:hypothetical protein